MKVLFFLLGLAIFLGAADFKAAFAEAESDLRSLLTGREYEQYQKKDEHKDRLRVLRHALERQLLILRSYSREGDAPAVTEKLLAIRVLTDHLKQVAVDTPRGSDSGELKNLEIKTRKLIETLNEIKVHHSIRLQSEFEETASGLEKLRPFLFRGLFKLKTNGLRGPLGLAASALHDSSQFLPSDPKHDETAEDDGHCRGIYFQSKRAVLERVIVSPAQDSFTAAEYSQLQNDESLSDRTQLFLRIAENRMEAIDSKTDRCDAAKGICLDSSLSKLLQGYQSAIHETMMKIDEAVRFRGKVDGTISRSLNRLRAAVSTFLPGLQRLAQHIGGHPENGPLLARIQDARRISINARDWSQCEGQALVE